MNDLTHPNKNFTAVEDKNTPTETTADVQATGLDKPITGYEVLGALVSLIVGFIFTFVSYHYELLAFRSFFYGTDTTFLVVGSTIAFSAILAFALNGAKICLAYALALNEKIGASVNNIRSLRLLMVVMSMMATIMVLAAQLDAPNANKPYERELRTTKLFYQDLRKELEQNYALKLKNRAVLLADSKTQIDDINRHDMETAQEGYRREQKVLKQNGDFYGVRAKRYQSQIRDIQTRIRTDQKFEEDLYKKDLSAMTKAFELAKSELYLKESEALSSIKIKDYFRDYESQNKLIASVVNMFNNLFSTAFFTTHHLTLFISILMTLIIEFVPLVLYTMTFRRFINA